MADLADGEADTVTLPKSNPWGGAEHADRWEAGNMAKVLLGRTDYKDAVTHFAGEFKRDPDMAKSSPQQAVRFMGQMKAAGLVEETTAEAQSTQVAQADTDIQTDAAPQTAPTVPAPTSTPAPAPGPVQTPEPHGPPQATPAPQPPTQEPAPSQAATQLASNKPSPRPPVEGHTIAKPPEEIEKEAAANGGYLYTDKDVKEGNAQQCTAFVKKATGLGPASTWKAGEKINGPDDPPLKPGTAIATFNEKGGYGTDKGRHAAVFVGYKEKNGQKGMEVLEQSKDRPVQRKFIPFTKDGKFIYQGQNYSVIK